MFALLLAMELTTAEQLRPCPWPGPYGLSAPGRLQLFDCMELTPKDAECQRLIKIWNEWHDRCRPDAPKATPPTPPKD